MVCALPLEPRSTDEWLERKIVQPIELGLRDRDLEARHARHELRAGIWQRLGADKHGAQQSKVQSGIGTARWKTKFDGHVRRPREGRSRCRLRPRGERAQRLKCPGADGRQWLELVVMDSYQ
jgi:hypothetical protein